MEEKFRQQVADCLKEDGYLKTLEHARVSLDNNCTCNECFCCACVEYFNKTKTKFRDIREVRDASNKIGNHWFDGETMAYFGTKFESTVYKNRFFITSEIPPYGKAGFTIRFVRPNGTIQSLFDLCHFKTLSEAKKMMCYLGKGLK
jgi:hypothetical protein